MRLARTVILLAFAVALAWPGTASAASAAQWPTTANTCGGIARERGSGQMDARGWFYIACSSAPGANGSAVAYPNVQIYDPAGTLQRIVPIDFGTDGVYEMREPSSRYGARDLPGDVAPSPDGSFLYVTRYDTRTAHRFARQANGSYALDVAWRPAPLPGGADVRGEFLASDANGDVYISSGLWAPGAPDTIAKFHADGSYETHFGRVGDSWDPGVGYDEFTGVTVTADGARVFVGDKLNSRVHRFDRRADGSYAATLVMGNTAADDPQRWGLCARLGKLASPYDVALSPGGELYVISTSCYFDGTVDDPQTGEFLPRGTIEVQRFAQDGMARGIVRGVARSGSKVHGIGVDRSGTIHLPQGSILLRRPDGFGDAGADVGGGGPMGGTAVAVGGGGPTGPVPGSPDTVAPTITTASAPVTVAASTITLTLAANDDRGVVEVRVREDGYQYAWRAWTTSLAHRLTGGPGLHEIVVEVRDAAGNISRGALVRVREVAPTDGTPVDRAAPRVTSVTAPAQVSGRRLSLTVRAHDNRGVTQVRFATEQGRWGAWQAVSGRRSMLLTAGVGWKGVFVQVRDAAGNRSRPWFQTVLSGPQGTAWWRGTQRADRIRMGAGDGHADLARYDGTVDRVTCGAGRDTVLLQRGDVASSDCERVVRVHTPAW